MTKLKSKKTKKTKDYKEKKHIQKNKIQYTNVYNFNEQEEKFNFIKQKYVKKDAYMYQPEKEEKPKKIIKIVAPKPITLPYTSKPTIKNNYIILGKPKEKLEDKPKEKLEEKVQQKKINKPSPWKIDKNIEYPVKQIKSIKRVRKYINKVDIKPDDEQGRLRELSEILADKLHKTVMCKNILKKGKCYVKDCRFAHSEYELVSPKCGFGDLCLYKKTTCKFMHPTETEEEYKQRIKIMKEEELKKKKQMKKEKKKELKTRKRIKNKKDSSDDFKLKTKEEIELEYKKMEKEFEEKLKAKRLSEERKEREKKEKEEKEEKPKKKSRWDVMGDVKQQSKKKSRWDVMDDIKQQPRKKSRWDVKDSDIIKQLEMIHKISPNFEKLTNEMLIKGNWDIKVQNLK